MNIGLPSAGYVAAPVLATDSSSNAVKLVSSGGDIQFAAYAGAPISYTGSGSPSFAVNLQTSASGAINATTNDKLNDTVGSACPPRP